jgi:cell division protein FtsB
MARADVTTQQRAVTKKRLVIIATLTAIVIGFVLFSSYGVLSRYNHEGHVEVLQQEQSVLRLREDSLRRAIHTLLTDTTELERLARERYGYVRPGEQVFIIRRDTTP